jgi:DNA-binding transcriptional LysR family regulator
MAWDDLRYVLKVAEEGTLSGAARALGVNHSTVLRRVTAFEEKKGLKLFERTGSGYTPIAKTRHLLTLLRSIEEQVNGLDRAIAMQGLELDGPIRITTTDSIAASGLLHHVAAFQSRHPGVLVELNITNNYVNFSRLDADITVRPAPSLPGELAGERACDLAMRIYATPHYLEGNQVGDRRAHRWLGVASPILSTAVGDWQRQNLPESSIVLRSNSFVGLRDVAETGLGLALLPCCLGDRSPHLVRAEVFPDSLTTSIWVATHRDMIGSTKARSILTWFAEAIRKDADLFEGRAASGLSVV